MTVRSITVCFAALSMTVVQLGCQPAATPPTPTTPVSSTPAANNVSQTPADLTPKGSRSPQGSPSAGGADTTEDLNSPLTFELTEEERARQAAEGPVASDRGSVTDAVPEALKSGPVGSLGRALFKGVLGGGDEASSEDSDGESEGESAETSDKETETETPN